MRRGNTGLYIFCRWLCHLIGYFEGGRFSHMSFGRRNPARLSIALVVTAVAIALTWSAHPARLSAVGGPLAVPTKIQIPIQSFEVEPRGTIDVSSLPTPGASGIQRRSAPLLTRNPIALAQWKHILTSTGSSTTSFSPISTIQGLPSFPGLNAQESCGRRCEPPDTSIAAGPDEIFEVAAGMGRISDKSGNPIKEFSLNSLFNVGSNFSTGTRVKYDTLSGRWFVSMSSLNSARTSGEWDLAVSTTGDPTGIFTLYAFSTTGSLPDFDGLGFNDDKIVQSAHAFKCTDSGPNRPTPSNPSEATKLSPCNNPRHLSSP